MIRALAAIAFLLSFSVAEAQIVTPAPSGYQRLSVTGTSVGNGADTTEDILQSYTLAAGQLANVGDTIHIFASGTYGATTDTKTIRVRVGGISGSIIANPQGAGTTTTRWSIDAYIIKTGSNTQSFGSQGAVLNANGNGTTTGTLTATDTSQIQILVTGQNSTTATAGSLTCQTFIVDYMH